MDVSKVVGAAAGSSPIRSKGNLLAKSLVETLAMPHVRSLQYSADQMLNPMTIASNAFQSSSIGRQISMFKMNYDYLKDPYSAQKPEGYQNPMYQNNRNTGSGAYSSPNNMIGIGNRSSGDTSLAEIKQDKIILTLQEIKNSTDNNNQELTSIKNILGGNGQSDSIIKKNTYDTVQSLKGIKDLLANPPTSKEGDISAEENKLESKNPTENKILNEEEKKDGGLGGIIGAIMSKFGGLISTGITAALQGTGIVAALKLFGKQAAEFTTKQAAQILPKAGTIAAGAAVVGAEVKIIDTSIKQMSQKSSARASKELNSISDGQLEDRIRQFHQDHQNGKANKYELAALKRWEKEAQERGLEMPKIEVKKPSPVVQNTHQEHKDIGKKENKGGAGGGSGLLLMAGMGLNASAINRLIGFSGSKEIEQRNKDISKKDTSNNGNWFSGFNKAIMGLFSSIKDFFVNFPKYMDKLGDKIVESISGIGHSISPEIGDAIDGVTGKNGSASALIGAGEGSYNSVNRGEAGGNRSGTEALTSKTWGQVKREQNALRYNAAGKFQIIRDSASTYSQLGAKFYGVTDNSLFNAETQEKLGAAGFFHKRPDIGRFVRGEEKDITKAGNAMAKEWASFPMLRAEQDKKGIVRNVGQSYYGQRVAHNPNQSIGILMKTKEAYDKARSMGKSEREAELIAFSQGSSYLATPEQNKLGKQINSVNVSPRPSQLPPINVVNNTKHEGTKTVVHNNNRITPQPKTSGGRSNNMPNSKTSAPTSSLR